MTNRYYDPGQQRAERVNDLFAAIAPRYDLINDLQSFGLHRIWKRRVARLAVPKPGLRGLDLCSGTGDVAFGLARQGARMVGLDFSGPMLAVAERRARALAECFQGFGESTPVPSFCRGDAQSLPFPDNTFDVVTVSYGLRNLTRWEQGLEEMHRVAKPGGTLLVLDFGKPDNRLWRAVYFAYLRWIVPRFGQLFCGDSQTHAYILESLQHYPAQHGVAEKMRTLNCQAVEIIPLLAGMMTINLGQKR